MNDFFVILGGMGTEATEAYIHVLNQKTPAHKDQDYLNYILLNHATIPDRTAYILNHKNNSPLLPLEDDITQMNRMFPEFYVLPCNTAHYFYNTLQEKANAPILNMPKEAVQRITKSFPRAKRIGLIATKGTIKDKIYDQEINKYNVRHPHHKLQLIKPTNQIEHEVMKLIYKNIKAKNDANPYLYLYILKQMILDMRCDAVILGCTELSLAQERTCKSLKNNTLASQLLANNKNINEYVLNHVIDAQSILADNTIRRALYARKHSHV